MSDDKQFDIEATRLTIQKAVSDYTRRTPPHLRDCDVLTGHIIRALENAAAQASTAEGGLTAGVDHRRGRKRTEEGPDQPDHANVEQSTLTRTPTHEPTATDREDTKRDRGDGPAAAAVSSDKQERQYRKTAPAENLRILGARLWEQLSPAERFEIGEAIALLESTPSATLTIPNGWKLVPEQPTERMLDACIDLTLTHARAVHSSSIDWEAGYKAMLDAVPSYVGEKK